MADIKEILEAKKEQAKPQFRVFNFAYQFKVGKKRVLKADKQGVYTPETKEDTEFLTYQVSKGLIHFN